MIEDIRRRLAVYSPRPMENEGRSRAAVLVPLYTHAGALHVILTKRTDRVETHRGEISFPGGMMDATDPDLRFTALRESHEEIGLHPTHVEIVGQVDDIVTITSFHVTAYVGEVHPERSPYPWLPQVTEVAELLEVPLEHLLDPANTVELPRLRDGQTILQPAFRYGDHFVWGATYRMLRNFLDVAVVDLSTVATPS